MMTISAILPGSIVPRSLSRFKSSDAPPAPVLVAEPARKILTVLKKMTEVHDTIGPEQLMTNLPDGPERSHVSRLLISSSFLQHNEEAKLPEEMAEEVLVWLMRYRFKKEIGQLSEEIRGAQQNDDQERLEELLHRKAELNKHLAAMSDGGG